MGYIKRSGSAELLLPQPLSTGTAVELTEVIKKQLPSKDLTAFKCFSRATNNSGTPFSIHRQSSWTRITHSYSETRTFSQEGHIAGTGKNIIASYRDYAGRKFRVLIKDVPETQIIAIKQAIQNARGLSDTCAQQRNLTVVIGSSLGFISRETDVDRRPVAPGAVIIG